MVSVDSRIVVAHIVVNLDIGGLERVVLNILRGVDSRRFRSVLICLRDGGALLDDVPQDVAIHALNKSDRLDYWLFVRLARLLRREGVDVVHCHNFGPLIYGSVAARLARTRVAYTAHGKYSSRRLRGPLVRRLGRLDRIVAVSEDARQVAIDEAGCDPQEVETIINGVDVDAFDMPGTREQKRAELGLAPDAMVFGMVARLTQVKDHDQLLRAFVQVRVQHPSAALVIVGDGELESEVRERVVELRLEREVHMLGARRDVAALLSAMDCFVLSSYSEGTSITLLEASAAGLPIVATDVGGNPEVVADNETGVIVPARDAGQLASAMSWMVDNRSQAREMGAAGKVRVEAHYGVRRMVTEYERIYQELIPHKGTIEDAGRYESVSQ